MIVVSRDHPTPVFRVVEPTERSLDELAEDIRRASSTAKRRSEEANEANFALGRALVEARRRFPSDREFGQWCAAERFGFSRQWSLTLRYAAQHETEVRALLTSNLSVDRGLSFSAAIDDVRRQGRTGPPDCENGSRFRPHDHVRHPLPSTGWLCLTGDDDAAARIAWADGIMATDAAHREAERRRLAGDGQQHDFVGGAASGWKPFVPPVVARSEASLRRELAYQRAVRKEVDRIIARLEQELAALTAPVDWDDR